MKITQLFLYPIKSLGAIAVAEAVVEARGFRHDRRFMLVEPLTNENGQPYGRMMTQRDHPLMALIDVNFGENETLRVWHRHHPDDVFVVSLNPAASGETLTVSVWDSHDFDAQVVGAEADAWFSQVLQTPCRLVYMPDTTQRTITSAYRQPDAHIAAPVVSFADGFPYLVISTESLTELNLRLDEPVEMSRFRPNIVVQGADRAHDEDSWAHFRVAELDLYGVKPCARCVMTTIDPQTGHKGKEPLRTLTTYRRAGQKILFGQNVMVAAGTKGLIRVGDSIEVLQRMETSYF